MSITLQLRDAATDDSSSTPLFSCYSHDDTECPLVMEAPHRILSIGEVYRKWFQPETSEAHLEDIEEDELRGVSLFMDPEPLQEATYLTFDLDLDAAAMDCTFPVFLELPG
jgi:hypothetical protein